jgi:hypothetical protein
MILKGGDRYTRTKSYPTATLSIINPTETGPKENSGLGGDRPQTIRQTRGTVMRIAGSRITIVDMNRMPHMTMLLQTAAGATDFGDHNIEKNSFQIMKYAHCKSLTL